jgi:hypothetical protein
MPVTARLARGQQRNATDGDDKDKAEHQRGGKQATFIVDDAIGHAGAGDADRDDGGGDQGRDDQTADGEQGGDDPAAALGIQRAFNGGGKTVIFNGLAHDEITFSDGIKQSDLAFITREAG